MTTDVADRAAIRVDVPSDPSGAYVIDVRLVGWTMSKSAVVHIPPDDVEGGIEYMVDQILGVDLCCVRTQDIKLSALSGPGQFVGYVGVSRFR